jgi:hypothetical protein
MPRNKKATRRLGGDLHLDDPIEVVKLGLTTGGIDRSDVAS